MLNAMTKRPVLIPAPDADVCLGFADTRYWRGTATPTDELRQPEDLLRWAEKAERLPAALVNRFDRSAALLTDAIGVRETIHRCFAATAAGREADEADLAALNAALAEAPPRKLVRPGGWEVEALEPSVALLLAPVLWSAADLMVGRQLPRVRQCSNPACGWLFLDDSKSGNRRWCSMSACGNRAKAHRHYQRQKAG
jgi:predicted RNA-binding Zn ribbon-like protein